MSKKKKKKVYIVLTYSGTVISKVVRFYTKKDYSHVSISLDNKLENMYSFGRRNAYNPFWTGFVQESPNYGFFKRFKNTDSLIYYIEVDDDQYNNIKDNLKKFELSKNNYSFNFIGLIGAGINVKIERKNKMYCAEFVKNILESSNVNLNIPNIAKPEDFIELSDKHVVYRGKLIDYKI